MPKTRVQKEEIMTELRDCFARAKSVIVSSYGAMTVAQSQLLRKALAAEDSQYFTVKKTLVDVLAKERPELGIQPREWTGSIGLVFGFGDEIAPAKVLAGFRKKNDVIEAIGAIFEGRWIGRQEVVALSTMPTKQQLRGQIVGLLNAPIQGLVRALNAVPRNLVGVVDAISKK